MGIVAGERGQNPLPGHLFIGKILRQGNGVFGIEPIFGGCDLALKYGKLGQTPGAVQGSRDKERVLDPYRETIKEYLQLKLPLRRIRSIVNLHLERPIRYPAYRYFVQQDLELLELWTQKSLPSTDS